VRKRERERFIGRFLERLSGDRCKVPVDSPRPDCNLQVPKHNEQDGGPFHAVLLLCLLGRESSILGSAHLRFVAPGFVPIGGRRIRRRGRAHGCVQFRTLRACRRQLRNRINGAHRKLQLFQQQSEPL
jgi:hypothetical protein